MIKRFALVLLAAAVAITGCRTAATTQPAAPIVQFSSNAIDTACFVKLYQSDGSYYMTRQSQKIDPSTSLLQVWGDEPDGHYLWQFSVLGLAALDGQAQAAKWLPEGLSAQGYCRLVLASFQTVTVIQAGTAPVRILGNWGYPMGSDGDLTWYRSKDSAQAADIVTLTASDGTLFIARGYGYHAETTGLVPSKVEVFKADAAAMNEQLLMRLDYVE